MAADLGRFFGAKFRAGVLYRIFERTGDRAALEEALKAYRAARDAWAGIAARTKGVYVADITVGETRQLRGHWADRLADIDADIAAVAAKLDSAKPAQAGRIDRPRHRRGPRPTAKARRGRTPHPAGQVPARAPPGGGIRR